MSSGQTVLKQAGISRVVPIAVWAACAAGGADAIVEGTPSFAVHAVVALSAVALATWLVLFSPHFAVDAHGVTILNPARVVRVPFGALVDLRIGLVVSVLGRFAQGRERKITAWNAPGLKRRRPTRHVGGFSGGGAPSTQSEVALVVGRFREPWEAAHPGGDSSAEAAVSWRWREWVALAVLIVVNVAIRLR